MLQHRTGGARRAFGTAIMKTAENLPHFTHRLELLFKIGKLLLHHFLDAFARLHLSGLQSHEFTDLAQREANFLRLANEAQSGESPLVILTVSRGAPRRISEQFLTLIVTNCLRVNADSFCEF